MRLILGIVLDIYKKVKLALDWHQVSHSNQEVASHTTLHQDASPGPRTTFPELSNCDGNKFLEFSSKNNDRNSKKQQGFDPWEEYGDESTCTLMPLAVEMGGAFLQTCEIHSQARGERKARRHLF